MLDGRLQGPARLFDWASAGFEEPPTITDWGPSWGRQRFRIDVRGMFRLAPTPEKAEALGWTAVHDGALLPSRTGLLLQACPHCGRAYLTVEGPMVGYLNCPNPDCSWTEVGHKIGDTNSVSALPWPKDVLLRRSLTAGPGMVAVYASHKNGFEISTEGETFEEAAARAFDWWLRRLEAE